MILVFSDSLERKITKNSGNRQGGKLLEDWLYEQE